VPVTETAGPEQTERAGAALAAQLRPGDVVLIAGELGSGKTTFVRGAARGLGVEDPVTSPTFTIGQRYAARDGLVVSHLDLYRLQSLADEDPELLDPYLGPDRIAFVEWPEVAEGELEHVTHRVVLEHLGGDRRRVTVSANTGP
jgi:tRNA threonylcarbamoyladenosine biosynthesis protein TsaE